MHKLSEIFIKYIGGPLLKYSVGIIISWAKDAWETYKKTKEIKDNAKKLEEAKTDEEINDAHRSNSRNIKL